MVIWIIQNIVMAAGWFAKASWQKIDGVWYHFDADGYMSTSRYVEGYWVNSDGACE